MNGFLHAESLNRQSRVAVGDAIANDRHMPHNGSEGKTDAVDSIEING